MSRFWKFMIGCLVGLLAILFLLFMYLLEKPNPTVDYFTQYNNLTRPEPFDPSQNAAELLKKLPEPDYSSMTEDDWMGYVPLDTTDYPDKINSEDKEKLKKWLAKNQPQLDLIVEASGKPYYYYPVDLSSFKTELLSSSFSTSDYSFYELGDLLSWAAVYNLHEGDTDASIRYLQAILDLSEILRRQYGHFQQYEVSSLVDDLDILSNFQNQNLSADALKKVQQFLLNAEIDCTYDDSVTRLCFYDYIQKTFTPGDHGHLSPLVYIKQEVYAFTWSDTPTALQCLYNSFKGERRKKTVDRMEAIFQRFDALKGMTPSMLSEQGIDLESEINTLSGDNEIVSEYASALLFKWRSPCQFACKLHALAAMMAIERYRRDHQNHPESLQALLTAGYLDRLPEDAFSGKPLIYRMQEKGFLLYSVGIDGEDDGGFAALCKNCGEHLTDWGEGPVYRPGSPIERYPSDPKDALADHIFWPIPEMDGQTEALKPEDIFGQKIIF